MADFLNLLVIISAAAALISNAYTAHKLRSQHAERGDIDSQSNAA